MTQESNKGDKVFIAVLYGLAAHFMLAIMGASAKYISTTHHVAEITFYRSVIIIILVAIYILITKKTDLLHTKKPLLIATRAIVGVISMIVTYAALAHLHITYATVIFFMATIITPVLAVIFLKEHIGIHRWSAVAVGMIGVVIIAQPSGELSMWGLIFALSAACMHASMAVVMRGLKTESPLTVNVYFALAGIVIAGAAMPWIAQPINNITEVGIFVLVALTGGFGQLFMATAYKYAPASFIAPFAYSALLWTILLDVFYWNNELDFASILAGAGLILTAQIYIIYREYVNKNKKQDA